MTLLLVTDSRVKKISVYPTPKPFFVYPVLNCLIKKINFFKPPKKSEKRITIKLEKGGGGISALMVGPLRKELFFAAFLTYGP